jgi:uncharacterized membrane protein
MTPLYLTLKVAHVVAAIVLVGTSVAIGVWKEHGDRSGDARTIAHTLDGILLASRRLIMPSSILLILAGFGMTGVGHLPIGQAWIVWSIVLLVVATVAGTAGLGPTSRTMRALLGDPPQSGGAFDRERYATLSGRWLLWHRVTLLAGVLAVVLMVFRPL